MTTTRDATGTERDHADTARARAIARLRAIADLCERVPGLPVPEVLDACVGNGRTDDEAHAELDRIADLLHAAGFIASRSDRDGFHDVFADAENGVYYRAFSVDSDAMAAQRALNTYSGCVTP